MIVALIEPIAEVFIPINRLASEEEPGFRRPSGDWLRAVFVGGRCETQSWTRSDTFGFESRLSVLRDAGLVVIIMIGPAGRCGDVVAVVLVVELDVLLI